MKRVGLDEEKRMLQGWLCSFIRHKLEDGLMMEKALTKSCHKVMAGAYLRLSTVATMRTATGKEDVFFARVEY